MDVPGAGGGEGPGDGEGVLCHLVDGGEVALAEADHLAVFKVDCGKYQHKNTFFEC